MSHRDHETRWKAPRGLHLKHHEKPCSVPLRRGDYVEILHQSAHFLDTSRYHGWSCISSDSPRNFPPVDPGCTAAARHRFRPVRLRMRGVREAQNSRRERSLERLDQCFPGWDSAAPFTATT